MKACNCGLGHFLHCCTAVSFADRYRAANDQGMGNDPDRGETVADVVCSYVADGASVVQQQITTDDVAVISIGGRLVAIGGDGSGFDPWECCISRV
jgi:hypothetical protein